MMTIQIDSNIPGGNVILERIDGSDVFIRPDLRDTQGPWFYWHFRLRGAAGRTLRFHMTQANTLTRMGAAVSLDVGWNWRWLGPSCLRDDESFEFACPAEASDVRLSMGMPYTLAQWRAFTSRYESDPRMVQSTLCRSAGGREVEQWLVGCVDREPRYRVVLTARHHCCEMMASYTLEGLLDAALDDTELGRWFSERVRLFVIPMVDVDGVEAGDQGKNRRPRDHNRDYEGQSIYPQVAAIREAVPRWASPPARVDVALDLHCPWIRGTLSETIYMVGLKDAELWRQQQMFGQQLESLRTGSLPYDHADNLPFGEAWNVADNYEQGCSFARWASSLPGVRMVSTLEIPYAWARGREVNAASARALGYDLALALRAYLEGRAPERE